MEWEQEQLRRGGHLADDSADKAPVKQIYKAAPSKSTSHLFFAFLTHTFASPNINPNPNVGSRHCKAYPISDSINHITHV
jgi:hypothetical protein